MKKRFPLIFILIAILITVITLILSGCGQSEIETESNVENAQGVQFNNKLADSGSDPWIILKDGVYYYCYSADGGVCVAAANSLPEIGKSDGVKVWTPDDEKYAYDIWAPELHYLHGKWYIYVAADDGDNFNHRMLCLEGTTQDPTEPFITKSVMKPETDRWAIDGTVMEYESELYFIWSGWEEFENVDQRIYIARLENPWTVSGDRIELSKPEYRWERKGGEPKINEGPTALELNGTQHIVYSASGSWCDDYCLGLLTLTGNNPMDAAGWTKSKHPVFQKTKKIFGPGHASFTTTEDGSQHFIVYHANEEKGSGWGGRALWAQEFTIDENNYPVFGEPLPAGSMQTINQ